MVDSAEVGSQVELGGVRVVVAKQVDVAVWVDVVGYAAEVGFFLLGDVRGELER